MYDTLGVQNGHRLNEHFHLKGPVWTAWHSSSQRPVKSCKVLEQLYEYHKKYKCKNIFLKCGRVLDS